ncbi:hypothetical protein J4443_00120 [Candidatus Woesearchaeota archaeon]|nr:hypothetical protein [Candidatus Woesearchaeota archaeon]
MVKLKKSDYIKLSRTLIRKLYDENCFGKGSIYIDNLKRGVSQEYLDKVETVLDALVKQEICGKKRKEHGWKYFLKMERLDKIKEILKEKGSNSIIPILLIF